MRFQGTMVNPNTHKEEEIDVEAFDETPEIEVKPNDDGSGSLIGPHHQEWGNYPQPKFYVGTVVFSDGTEEEITSTNLPLGIELVDETEEDSNNPDDLDDDD